MFEENHGKNDFMRQFLSVLLVSCFTLLSCQKPDENVIGKVGEYEFTVENLRNSYYYYFDRSGQALEKNSRTIEAIFNSEFDKFLLIDEARQRGYDEKPENLKLKERMQRSALIEKYLDENVLDTVQVTESDLADLMLRFNTTIRASHLFARTESEIREIEERLESGDSFGLIAQEVFTTDYLKKHGGDVGYFRVDEMDLAFEDAAFALAEGDVSKPVKTEQGYSIIKVTDKWVRPVITENQFNSKRAQLTSFEQKREIKRVQNNYVQKLDEAIKLNIEEDELEEILASISVVESPSQLALPENELIAELNGEKIFFSDLADNFYVMAESEFGKNSDIAKFRGLLIQEYLLRKASQTQLSSMEIEVLNYQWGIQLARQLELNLMADVPVKSEDVRAYFIQNQSDFVSDLKLNLQRIVVFDKNLANQLQKQALEKANFTQLVMRNTKKGDDLLTQGMTGLKSVRDFNIAPQKLNKLNEGDVTEVMQVGDNEYHIYKCVEIIQPRPMSYDEASERIRKILKRDEYKAVKTEMLKEKRNQNRVIINNELLQNTIVNL
jgi:parvulin-like peptidyl-prolyl isomerase